MTGKFDALSEDDISKISEIVGVLDKSGFDYLTLELAGFKITVGTGAAIPEGAPEPAVSSGGTSAAAPAPAALAPAAEGATPAAPAPAAAPAAAAPLEEGLIDVVATTMGTFYARPDPQSEPFIAVGSTVTPDTSVGLIEVMKLFNAVTAGVDGVVIEICVGDAQLVEYGQVLCRVRPAE
ncbi:acetyl-CoA carboxylase biotin carboxyl carrier protein subunit [Amorphus sp. 3PC139-8]|uniref:acetyl-CoA carboxylase biotin carboxyl carrier protein n=1 Tax=Amorphus sp. 3PC139-8 TaxID=2735676 RepID=UPI00345D7271